MRIYATSVKSLDNSYIHLGYLSANTGPAADTSGLAMPGIVIAILGACLFARRKSVGWVFDFTGARLLGVLLLLFGAGLAYIGFAWRR